MQNFIDNQQKNARKQAEKEIESTRQFIRNNWDMKDLHNCLDFMVKYGDTTMLGSTVGNLDHQASLELVKQEIARLEQGATGKAKKVDDRGQLKWVTEDGFVLAHIYSSNDGYAWVESDLRLDLFDRQHNLVKKKSKTPTSQKTLDKAIENLSEMAEAWVESI